MKPEPTPAPVSTSHHMATKLDVLAMLMLMDGTNTRGAAESSEGAARCAARLTAYEADARAIIDAQDRLQSEKEKPS